MVGQQPSDVAARELAVVLHDLAWLLPRTIDPPVQADLEPMPQSELEVMRLLVRRPGLSLRQVAGVLALQPSNVSATVRALVGGGLLERRPDAGDGRVIRLHPTRAAIEARRTRERAWGAALHAHLNQLGPIEAATAVAAAPALRALAEQLSGAPQAQAAAERAGDGRARSRRPGALEP